MESGINTLCNETGHLMRVSPLNQRVIDISQAMQHQMSQESLAMDSLEDAMPNLQAPISQLDIIGNSQARSRVQELKEQLAEIRRRQEMQEAMVRNMVDNAEGVSKSLDEVSDYSGE